MARVAEPAPKRSYTRDEVCRLLDIRPAVLEQWETHAFVPRAESYAFQDLVALKTLRQLRAKRFTPARIRMVLDALRTRLVNIHDPLSELKIYTDGRRLSVQVDGRRMEPLSGQLLLDFDKAEINRLLQFPGNRAEQTLAQAVAAREAEAVKWFDRAVEMEQTGAPSDVILGAYHKALECDPEAPSTHLNLGTVHFNLKQFSEAEKHYREAIRLRPAYALAHYNLGSLYDEQGNREPALACYLTALDLQPDHADAHYNVALLYQAQGDTLKAVAHWRTYLKLDPTGFWAGIARRELQRLRQQSVVDGGRKRNQA